MKGACGLFTFVLKAGKMNSIVKFCESLKHIMMAVSWGGHESLVIPKCSGLDPKDFDPANREHRYVRMYAGLEDAGYLIADLEQALGQMD
jgi:cystathionine beta-lyase/cystathionine gamma-synthase